MNACEWLHRSLETLTVTRWPFDVQDLPRNGIYFFYEDGETWGHGDGQPRIVRIGTHRDGNFRSRISDHFLCKPEREICLISRSVPHVRSIFRKHIGRALLNRPNDDYRQIWELDFTTRKSRAEHSHRRDVNREQAIEDEVTFTLREKFTFRYIEVELQRDRMGSAGLEPALIGTLASCRLCTASASWLGRHSPQSISCEIADCGWSNIYLPAR